MNELLKSFIIEIEENRKSKSPVKRAWVESCKRIGLGLDNPFIQFGLRFCNHPDLIQSSNAYHNHLHSADAIISASFLAKEEFSSQELKVNGSLLLFAMMCHDIAHNGGHNNFEYELEIAAVNSMNNYVIIHPELLNYWNNNLKDAYGEWHTFSQKLESVILGTDFKNGPITNLKNYEQNPININKVRLLATEADILPSCTSTLGPALGLLLAQEQNNPNIGTWQGREFFIKNLVKFGTLASKRCGIQEHIDIQIEVINTIGVEKLDNQSANGNFLIVAEEINKIVNKKIQPGTLIQNNNNKFKR